MNAQTPFDTPECAHGIYDDEYCHECALIAGRAMSPRRRLAIITVLGLASWVMVAAGCVAVGVAVGKLTLSWLGVAL